MTDSKPENKSKALHDLIGDDFRQLIDVIEQKQIVHESINTGRKADETSFEEPVESLQSTARRLKQHSLACGAETLAEYFQELEGSIQKGKLSGQDELIHSIRDEFEKVREILSGSGK